jgi:PilZ domain
MSGASDARQQRLGPEVASLTTDIRVRVLNVSAAGCLIETRRALEIGSVATLSINVAGADFEDTVQIVRCQEITGAGAIFHLGATFLTTSVPSIESLRYLFRRQSDSVGYIRVANGEASKDDRSTTARTIRSREEME